MGRINNMLCARDFVFFVLAAIGVRPVRNNQLTRHVRRRIGQKLQKRDNLLYFKPEDTESVFDALMAVLLYNTNSSVTRVPVDMVNRLVAHKTTILQQFRARMGM